MEKLRKFRAMATWNLKRCKTLQKKAWSKMFFLSLAVRQGASRQRLKDRQRCVSWWKISSQLDKTRTTLGYLRDSLTDANDAGLRIRQELQGARADCAYLRIKLEKLEEQKQLEETALHESLDQQRIEASRREEDLVRQQEHTMQTVLGKMQGEMDAIAQLTNESELATASLNEAAMQGVLLSAQGALAEASAAQAESNLEHLRRQEEHIKKVKALRLSLGKLDLDLSFEETSVKKGGLAIALRNWQNKALTGQILMHASASAITAGASRSMEARVAEAMGELRKKLLDTQIEAASTEATLKREIAELQAGLRAERVRHIEREKTFDKKEVQSFKANSLLRDEHVSDKSKRWSRRSEQMGQRREAAAKAVAERLALLKNPPTNIAVQKGGSLRKKHVVIVPGTVDTSLASLQPRRNSSPTSSQ